MKIQKYFHWSFAIVIGLLGVSLFNPDWHIEFSVFRTPDDRPLMYFFYVLPIFRLFGMLPEPVAYGLMSVWTVATMYIALRLFGGKEWMVNTSIAYLWLLLFGQTDGLAAGGIVIAWYALQKKRPYLLGLGLIIASIKPQMTIGLMLLLWWWSPSRIKALVIPALVLVGSFLVYGFWIPEWINIVQSLSGNMSRVPWNYSWWPMLGAWIWILWPLILPLRMERMRKMIAVGAVSMLTIPYFPFYSTLIFYAMPIPGFFYWISQLVVFAPVFGQEILKWLRVLPMLLLLWAIYPAVVPARWQARLASYVNRLPWRKQVPASASTELHTAPPSSPDL